MAKKSVKSSKKTPEGRVQNIIGLVLAVLALITLAPLITGILSIVMGYWGYKKGDKKLGKTTMILGVIFAIIGMAVSIYIATRGL